MTDVHTPCQDDPDAWFISRDGRQYADDDLIPIDLIEFPDYLSPEAREDILDEATEEAKAEALVRRRHAKDRCFTECYFRTQCLSLALKNVEGHGTWGGYYEEELREIRRLRDKKRRERNGEA